MISKLEKDVAFAELVKKEAIMQVSEDSWTNDYLTWLAGSDFEKAREGSLGWVLP